MRINRWLTGVTSVTLAGGAAFWLATDPSGPRTAEGVAASSEAVPSVDGRAVKAGSPYIHTRPVDDEEGADGKVSLRSCPQAGADKPVGQNPWGLNCLVLARLENNTAVTMGCWVSTNPPPEELDRKDERGKPVAASAKWFKVTVAGGVEEGRKGWVWSDLVREQTDGTSKCASIGHENDPAAPPPEPLVFRVTGVCTSAGGQLSSRSGGFTPGGEYAISAVRPDGSTYPLDSASGTVAGDGSVGWKWPCEGDPAGTYRTELVDTSTGRMAEDSFTIGAAPSVDPARRTDPTPPVNPVQPPPAVREITVYNKVTDGPTLMREDKPGYLSEVTKNFCARNGCSLPDTELRTGDRITAVCQTVGERTTNGEDNNARDDGNSGLAKSELWYGIRAADGRFGYISAIWIEPGRRDGLGLPNC
ncbi:hypothetical protein [Streptomyces acidiscabies]|uniref:hypothetical protein n=1 Tax=Streptomyces acidiscabies TaxID=42234 RepID=UPI00095119D0|nr:hypothetical protein [Streptomyces acidiscabies]